MARDTYGEYGQCEATAKSTGERCGQPTEGPHGECRFHGGKSLKGEEHPGFEHGLFSDHLGAEECQTIDALDGVDDEDKLEELINWRLARLRRAVRALNDNEDQRTFWDAFETIVNKTGEIEAEEIKELGRTPSPGIFPTATNLV